MNKEDTDGNTSGIGEKLDTLSAAVLTLATVHLMHIRPEADYAAARKETLEIFSVLKERANKGWR